MTHKFKFLGALAGLALAQAASGTTNQQTAILVGQQLCHRQDSLPRGLQRTDDRRRRTVSPATGGRAFSIAARKFRCFPHQRGLHRQRAYRRWQIRLRRLDERRQRRRQFVKKSASTPRPIHDGVASWILDTPGSERFFSEGLLVESLTVNGVTVQVSLQDTGWKLLANVAVANNSLPAYTWFRRTSR